MIDPISICHTCSYRATEITQSVLACTVDGLDIVEHAKAGKCPMDFFRTRAAEARLIEQGYEPTQAIEGKCGC